MHFKYQKLSCRVGWIDMETKKDPFLSANGKRLIKKNKIKRGNKRKKKRQ